MADLNWGTHTALAVTLASSLPPSRLPSIKPSERIYQLNQSIPLNGGSGAWISCAEQAENKKQAGVRAAVRED